MLAMQDLTSLQDAASAEERLIVEGVVVALRSTGYLQLLDLDVRVSGHVVYLQGRLSSYYLKQKALQVVKEVPDVCSITDDIDVVR